MARHERFKLRSLDDLRDELDRLRVELPIDADFSILADAVRIGSLETANRFAVQPMEGFDAGSGGAPGELSFRRYRRYARGGAGLIWFEATAVLPDARTNPRQFHLHAGNVDTYAHLVDETRKAAREVLGRELVLVIQLTHSGRYSKADGAAKPALAHHSPVLDASQNIPDDYPLVTDDYLDRLQDTFVEAARLAARAGFDGVDIKACHGYLVSGLLASRNRGGKYGGSYENRTRMLLETVARVRQAEPRILVTTRINAFDGISHPYGWGVSRDDYGLPDLAEPLRLVGDLKKLGVPILNISFGSPYFNPHFGRPFDRELPGTSPPAEHPLEGIARIAGVTRRIQQSQGDLPVVAFGYAWLRHLMPHVAAGVIRSGGATLIGQGRGSFAYPDSPNDILRNGAMDPTKCCIACSACTEIMRGGGMVGCAVRDGAVYGPQLRRARQA